MSKISIDLTWELNNGEMSPGKYSNQHKIVFTPNTSIKADSAPDWRGDNPDSGTSFAPWRVYNIGNNSPVELMDYIKAIESAVGVDANKELLPLQPGDVPDTYADVDDLVREFEYKPSMSVTQGVKNFVEWYREYYNL